MIFAMAMTMTQKILAAHAGLDKVEAGQLIRCKLDMVLGHGGGTSLPSPLSSWHLVSGPAAAVWGPACGARLF